MPVYESDSCPQFGPGHVHLKGMGDLVAPEIEVAGGVALGHAGMLYSLPTRGNRGGRAAQP